MTTILLRRGRVLRRRGRVLATAAPPPPAPPVLDLRTAPVGITVGPRSHDTLSTVLAAWERSGFRRPRLFGDGAADLPAGYAATRRDTPVGAWPTWLAALRELVDREPTAAAYVLFQDDGCPCAHLAEFATRTWPAGADCLSLCTVDHYIRRTAGWHADPASFRVAGAQGFAFRGAAARELLCDRRLNAYRWAPYRGYSWSRGDGRYHIDGVVGEWLGRTGRPLWRHTPSLVGHIGERHTTLYPGVRPRPTRTTASWPGAEFDSLSLLPPEPTVSRETPLEEPT